MTYASIHIDNISLSFPQKPCFEGFSTLITPGTRIAIIGQNGSGKSTLLKMLAGQVHPNTGHIVMPADLRVGYVPQIVTEYDTLSGGQRFQKAFTQALRDNPDLLLLDEPTNHLDQRNRQSLFTLLKYYMGTVIVISHDVELLKQGFDQLWHIDQNKIETFAGSYEDYQRERYIQRTRLEHQREQLKRQQDLMHQKRMQEQERGAKSKAKGQKSIAQRKWATVVSPTKANRASSTNARKLGEIAQQQQSIHEQLKDIRLPDIIVPTFHLDAGQQNSGLCVSIHKGSVGYETPLLSNIHLSLPCSGKLAIVGNNGSGKSTLLKAILGDPRVKVAGEWYVPKPEEIGYLDQHYQTLDSEKTVLQTLENLVPQWTHSDIRAHLNTFLFRNNEAVNTPVKNLSGGEKARLCLAEIAAKPPRLLMLDEITNNVDLETRDHVIQVLREYPGSLIVVSHDTDFVKAIGMTDFLTL